MCKCVYDYLPVAMNLNYLNGLKLLFCYWTLTKANRDLQECGKLLNRKLLSHSTKISEKIIDKKTVTTD